MSHMNLAFHQVVQTTLRPPQQFESQSGLFWCREIIVVMNDGAEQIIKLFADTREALEVSR